MFEDLNKGRKFVPKSWGYEDWLANSPLYCGKDLFIKKGKRLSLHFHNLKTESFFCQSGEVFLEFYDDVELDCKFPDWKSFDYFVYNSPGVVSCLTLRPGDSFHIPIGRRHTLIALLDSHIFEFSTEHFDSDSIRILKGDDYNNQ